MGGCIKRIPNTMMTKQESSQSHSVQMYTALSTSPSVYDNFNMRRRHSEYALNNLTHKYSKHYRSTEKFRELEPKRKLELDLAIQNTFSTSINRKLQTTSKSYFGKLVTNNNNTCHSSCDSVTTFERDKSVDERTNNITDLSVTQPIIPKCFCFISSHGNRKFNYNLCKYHTDFSSSCRHHHNHSHNQQYRLQHNSYLHFQTHCQHTCKHSWQQKCRFPSSSSSVTSDNHVTCTTTLKMTTTTTNTTTNCNNTDMNSDNLVTQQ
ncbi:unnamed protein product [Heterobilharzia americana]|nr:unnamed protein product [Heterobilharzia americana]